MAYKSTYTGFEIDRAVGTVRKREKVWDNKQQKLTGKPGQVVGFDERGNAIPQDAPDSGDVFARVEKISLKANAWQDNAQNIYINGIMEEEGSQLIQPVPASACYNDYTAAEVRVSQSLNQLLFTCTTPPVADIDVFVVIQRLQPLTENNVLS